VETQYQSAALLSNHRSKRRVLPFGNLKSDPRRLEINQRDIKARINERGWLLGAHSLRFIFKHYFFRCRRQPDTTQAGGNAVTVNVLKGFH
jgi:hypothetical protein